MDEQETFLTSNDMVPPPSQIAAIFVAGLPSWTLIQVGSFVYSEQTMKFAALDFDKALIVGFVTDISAYRLSGTPVTSAIVGAAEALASPPHPLNEAASYGGSE